jgi:outer membrane lipoprotein SlyB
MTLSTLGAIGIALVMTGTAVIAQQKPIRVRATIEKVDGNTLTVKARNGKTMTIKTPDNVRVQGLAKASLTDIPVDTFIGVTAMPQPDGSVKAIAIHIFTEQQRKVVPQRHGPWDLQANSTMTTAVVASKVAATSGNELMVKYKDGEKKVVVTPQTQIVKVVGGSKADIKAGAHIIIMRADPEADGSYKAGAIYVGKDGITPPM